MAFEITVRSVTRYVEVRSYYSCISSVTPFSEHKRNRGLDPVRLKLESESLLLMSGATQANWRHGINKLQRPCGPRINLTFRQILIL